MTPPITYRLEVDTNHDNTFSSAIDDITAYVDGQINFQGGIQSAYESVSQPARMTFSVNNLSGDWDREGSSTEKLLNNEMVNWTINIPLATVELDNWTFSGWTSSGIHTIDESDATGSQTPSLGDHCHIVASVNGTTRQPLYMYQNVLEVGKVYRARISVYDRRPEVRPVEYRCGGVTLYQGHANGIFEFYFQATGTDFSVGMFEIGQCDVVFKSISVVEVPLCRVVDIGTLCRLRATYNGTTQTLFVGRITAMKPTPGTNAVPRMQFTVEDAMLDLLDKEYKPPLITAATTDDPLQRMFDDGVVVWPYVEKYWILGVPGSSELGLTTYILANNVADNTTLETGITEMSYVGDLADRGQGVGAQGYIRDIMNAEVDGRFYWNYRNQEFVFHNRHHDNFNATVDATFSQAAGDLHSVDMRYGEDIYNQVQINFSNREIGGAGSTIWTALNVPILVKQGQVRKISARYVDSTDPTVKISAKDFIQPVNGQDIIANIQSDGSGTDVSNFVTMTAEFGATAAAVYISNGYNGDVYITLARLRATPLTSNDQSVDDLDGASMQNYEIRPAPPQDIRLMDDPDLALNAAQYLLSRHKTAIVRLASLTLGSLANANTLDAAMNRVIGDRITVQIESENHTQDYFINGENRTITVGGDMPAEITFYLKPAARTQYWVLGTTGYSELGTTTILGF